MVFLTLLNLAAIAQSGNMDVFKGWRIIPTLLLIFMWVIFILIINFIDPIPPPFDDDDLH